jgi:uncharacterized membrane protein
LSQSTAALQTGISWILRIGVVLSVIFAGSGIILDYVRTGSSTLCLSGPSCDVWRITGGKFFDFAFATAGNLLGGVSAVGLVSLGVVILMITPYFRIGAAVVYYVVERDWKYVGITSTVFVLITVALLIF